MTHHFAPPLPHGKPAPQRRASGMLCAFLVLMMGHFGTPALADQTDPRLDGLFSSLAAAADPEEARLTEQLIWAIWYTYPDNPDIERRVRAARQAVSGADLETAEGVLDTVIGDAPFYAEGWNLRATVRYMRQDYAGSMADIAQVLQLEPRHFGALSGMGLIFLRRGDLEEALEAYRAAIAINPSMPGAQAHITFLEEELAGERL